MTPCFRSEAGAAATRAGSRQHQFSRWAGQYCRTGFGEDELERLTTCAEEVLKRLGLSYRVMLLCAGDMGFSARKTYDLGLAAGEEQLSGNLQLFLLWRFSGRRMNARFRHADAKSTQYVPR